MSAGAMLLDLESSGWGGLGQPASLQKGFGLVIWGMASLIEPNTA